MGQQVCNGAQIQCSFGAVPSSLAVLPVNGVMTNSRADANILDNVPMVNILPFGMCSSTANPEVAAATTAALGVLTPMPCIPVIIAPWTTGNPTVLIANLPIINNTSTCYCAWAGVISFINPGQDSVAV